MRSFALACLVMSSVAFSQWDVVLEEVNEFNEPVTYTNQTILIGEDGVVVFKDSLTLNNCEVQVDGFLDCSGNINLVNSTIEVFGKFDVSPAVIINETGASSIIATGNQLLEGNLSLQGSLNEKILVNSDYVQGDTEFIIIDPNSSTSSVIQDVTFYGGFNNIWIIDKRLDTSINNCFFIGADYGIWQDGKNNLTDIRFCLFVDNYTAIRTKIEPTLTNYAHLLVDNVIIDNPTVTNSYGCVVSGSSDSTKYGAFQFTNSIITNTYLGWYFEGNTYFSSELNNIAYYNNDYNGSHQSDNFETNKMNLVQSPFEQFTDPNIWPYFIDSQSPVADVELGYNLLQVCPGQLQTSLFSESVPRNKGIGIGVPLPVEYSSKIYEYEQDFNTDGLVNYQDFEMFAPFWNTDGNSIADLNDSNSVDTLDLVYFCDDWLDDGSIKLNVTENDNSLTVSYEDPNGLTDCEFAFFLDDEYLTMRDTDNQILTIDKSNYSNGEHYLRAIVIGENSNGEYEHYASSCYESTFESPLSNFKIDDTFDKDKGLLIKGDVTIGYEVVLEVSVDNQILWSETYNEDFSALVDPNSLNVNTASFDVKYLYRPSFLLTVLNLIPVEMQDDLIAMTQTSGKTSSLALEGKPDYSTAGLVICMLEDGWSDGVNTQDTGTARYADKMMRQKGIDTIVLRGFGDCANVTYDTIMKVFKKYKKISYMHIYAHGNYQFDAPYWFTGNIQRTGLKFNDGAWPVYNSRYWTENKSNGNVPDDYEYLKGKSEKGSYLGEFPFAPGQLKILVLEACYGLRNVATWRADELIEYHNDVIEDEENDTPQWFQYPYFYSDICFSFGILDTTQIAIGSAEKVKKGILYPYTRKFFNTFWQTLGQNSNIDFALDEAFSETLNTDLMDECRYRGRGDMLNIRLRENVY